VVFLAVLGCGAVMIRGQAAASDRGGKCNKGV